MVENPSCCHGAAVDRLGRLHDYPFWMFSFLLSGLSKTVYKGHTALFPLLLPFPFFFMLDFLVDSRISFIWRVKVYSGCSGGVDSFNGWSILL